MLQVLSAAETTGSAPGTATTTVDPNGYTAIRVNIPPIGFNKARVSIAIQDIPGALDLIDLEVPAVVVIDPGHGVGEAGGSAEIGTTGTFSKVTEHDAVLDIARRTVRALKSTLQYQRNNMKVFVTRSNRDNQTFQNRTAYARNHGCDVYVSLHFNSVPSVPTRRHPFGMWDTNNNRNLAEDQALARRIRQHVEIAIREVESEESRNVATDGVTSVQHESNLQKQIDTCADSRNGATLGNRHNPSYNGNMIGYTPCRATLIELEWMSNREADLLFNGNTAYDPISGAVTLTATADLMRRTVASGISVAIVNDLNVQSNN
jgi:N-acetylmuramoyl-L-alanine amidase